MNMFSLKALTAWSTLMIVTTSTCAFFPILKSSAERSPLNTSICKKVKKAIGESVSSVQKKIKLETFNFILDDMEISFNEITGYTAAIGLSIGSSCDPDTETNPLLKGKIDAYLLLINKNVNYMMNGLTLLKRPQHTIDLIRNALSDYIALALDYSEAVNMNNVGKNGGDERAIATELLLKGEQLNKLFSTITLNPKISQPWVELAQISMQGSQAARGVLVSGKILPSDPLKEGGSLAAFQIEAQKIFALYIKEIKHSKRWYLDHNDHNNEDS